MDDEDIAARKFNPEHLERDPVRVGSQVGNEILVVRRPGRVERTEAVLDDKSRSLGRDAMPER
jgi:hypothetical protein